MHQLPCHLYPANRGDLGSRTRCHFAVVLWPVFDLPQLQWRHNRLADGVHKASNVRDSPPVQLVVSLGRKTASVLKNEALPDNGQHTVASGFVPSDSIALIDWQ